MFKRQGHHGDVTSHAASLMPYSASTSAIQRAYANGPVQLFAREALCHVEKCNAEREEQISGLAAERDTGTKRGAGGIGASSWFASAGFTEGGLPPLSV
jgi:hypothetical protein